MQQTNKLSVVLLCRCQMDKTETWHMVCGKCWRTVSGGVVDGDDAHPDYRCLAMYTVNFTQVNAQLCMKFRYLLGTKTFRKVCCDMLCHSSSS